VDEQRSGVESDGTLVATMVFDDFAPQISVREKVANGSMLVVGANETTAHMMALVLYALAKHPEQRPRSKKPMSKVTEMMPHFGAANRGPHVERSHSCNVIRPRRAHLRFGTAVTSASVSTWPA